MTKLKKGGDDSGIDVVDDNNTQIKNNENVLIPPLEKTKTNRESKANKQSKKYNKSDDKKPKKSKKTQKFSWFSWLFS
jgi:hypothetical protein